MDAFDVLLRETMVLTAMLCLPVLAVGSLVGAAVAVLQAATQVQEQTLTVLPKILAVAAVVAAFGHSALSASAQLFHEAIFAIPSLVYGG